MIFQKSFKKHFVLLSVPKTVVLLIYVEPVFSDIKRTAFIWNWRHSSIWINCEGNVVLRNLSYQTGPSVSVCRQSRFPLTRSWCQDFGSHLFQNVTIYRHPRERQNKWILKDTLREKTELQMDETYLDFHLLVTHADSHLLMSQNMSSLFSIAH